MQKQSINLTDNVYVNSLRFRLLSYLQEQYKLNCKKVDIAAEQFDQFIKYLELALNKKK